MRQKNIVVLLVFLASVALLSSMALFVQNIQLKKDSDVNQKPFPTSSYPSVTAMPPQPNSTFCGGIAGLACSEGYICQYEEDYPDAGGTCVLQQTNYTCPPSGYVDCMPGPDRIKDTQCSAAAMRWYQTNCPDFQGAAL